MRVLVELEGICCEIRKARWAAYSAAVASIGLARADQDTFWRLLRTGAAVDRLVAGAKQHHLDAFEAHLADTCDTEDVVQQYTLRTDDLSWFARMLSGCKVAAILSLGDGAVRERFCTALPFEAEAPGVTRLSRPAAVGAAQLQGLTGSQPAWVLAASETVARTAAEAGLPIVGVAAGDCSKKRLAAVGAQPALTSLESLREAVANGDEALQALGLRLESPEIKPETTEEERELERFRDREARRQARPGRRER